jgi:hypothetical protein
MIQIWYPFFFFDAVCAMRRRRHQPHNDERSTPIIT